MERAETPSAHGLGTRVRGREYWAILLVSLAGLLLEIAYTRIVSYKLWYYYTYLVIGLAMLGIGSGGIAVALIGPLRRARTDRVISFCSLGGAVSVVVGYLVIAKLPIETGAIWDYGTRTSFANIAALTLICLMLFATFVAIGIVVSTLLGRGGEHLGRLYAADLVGAALACFIAIPLISSIGPPRLVFLAALILAAVGLFAAPTGATVVKAVSGVVAAALVVASVSSTLVPEVKPDSKKLEGGGGTLYSEWGPVFRVDVVEIVKESALLVHDGTYGSGIRRFDGNAAALTEYDADSRALPFRVLDGPPKKELIIGSAGGNEILASLRFGAPDIEAVELNPVTVSLLRDHFADYTGRIAFDPRVDLHQGDGRTYLARSDTDYDLVWYVAPDSYAANNAASAGAFVLSESYLYTTEMIEETLDHLSDDGIMVVQFGDLDLAGAPNRTARYIVTAREALRRFGVEDPTEHIMLAAHLSPNAGGLATIMVKRTPFTSAEVERFSAAIPSLTDVHEFYAPGRPVADNVAARAAAAPTDAELSSVIDAYPRDISVVTDDKPFFWHFTDFRTALRDSVDPLDAIDPEIAIGERVLLLLLVLAAIYAIVFLLLPFLVVRRQWAAMPHKAVSAIYFAALGLGFMLYEITMIQRLSRFLGYPTYSLTVTLAAILVATGVGAMVSNRLAAQRTRAAVGALVVLALLTVFYQVALDDIMDSLQSASFPVRALVAVVVLFPLGLCLGLFMPLGLGIVSRWGDEQDGQAYVAWAWAVNGFLSVVGSVLTTVLSMTFGFTFVQRLAFLAYCIAVIALIVLERRSEPAEPHRPLPPESVSPDPLVNATA